MCGQSITWRNFDRELCMKVRNILESSCGVTHFVETICVGGIWGTYQKSPDVGDVLFIVVQCHGYFGVSSPEKL